MLSTALALSLVLAAQNTNPAAARAEVEGDAATPMPLHFSGGLTHSVGSGTFMGGYQNNPTIASTLTLSPSFVWQDFAVAVNQRIGLEYTQSDYTTKQNQLELADTGLSVRYNGLKFPEIGLLTSFSGGYSVPISMSSRFMGSLGSLSLGARVTWLKEDLGLTVYGGLGGAYTQYVASLAGRMSDPIAYDDRSYGVTAPATCITRNPEESQNYACASYGAPFGWGPSAGVSWATLEGALSFGLDLGYRQSFSAFYGPDDEYKASNATAGYGLRQSMSSNVSASWSPTTWFALTGGLSTGQPFLSADGSRPRFPLWDFESPYNNNSSIYVDTTFSL